MFPLVVVVVGGEAIIMMLLARPIMTRSTELFLDTTRERMSHEYIYDICKV